MFNDTWKYIAKFKVNLKCVSPSSKSHSVESARNGDRELGAIGLPKWRPIAKLPRYVYFGNYLKILTRLGPLLK